LFRDLLELIQIGLKRILTSRIFALAVIFVCMFAGLVVRLFDLQIVQGEEYVKKYESKILRTAYTTGTRGNIYDCNGVVLARNELAYSVTIQDVGAYSSDKAKNLMILELVGRPSREICPLPLTRTGILCTPPHRRLPDFGFFGTFTGGALSMSWTTRTASTPPMSAPGMSLR